MALASLWETNFNGTNGTTVLAHVPTVVGSTPLTQAVGNEMTAPNLMEIQSNELTQNNLTNGIGNFHRLQCPLTPGTNKYRARGKFKMPPSGSYANGWGVYFRDVYSVQRALSGNDRLGFYKSGSLISEIDIGTPSANQIWTLDIGCHDADAADLISVRVMAPDGNYKTLGGGWSATPQDCVRYTDPSPTLTIASGGFTLRQWTASVNLTQFLVEQEAPPAAIAVTATLDPAVAGLVFQQNNSMALAATVDAIVSSLALGVQPGIIDITDLLSAGSGTEWVNRNDVILRFVSEATGQTVLTLTNVTTDANGALPQVSNLALQAGQWYEVTVRIPLTPPALGIWRYQAHA